ncbi:hypothetical protein CEUSTIGMA_g2457.t1 [Chlamydomonas eustigma]|uniref:Uncharacterized protein n=1 Tax=Chlamydomonas eustigma TaxID=1157962 RepID=A0A250WW15_9CHLO|nr:hypothetical protein CEUSTIGMA_g2457.t1 [Chlamydomonas eustigma]|eukprot:GAX75011.1 hypothetical protein CEUSTIGMA_g2457.t1 [Chlamydomonas eustigma]
MIRQGVTMLSTVSPNNFMSSSGILRWFASSEASHDFLNSLPTPKFLGGRYGSRLLRAGKLAEFQRMQRILGVERADAGTTVANFKSDRVTASMIQTLKFLPLDVSYKMALARYRIGAFGREVDPLLQKSKRFLDKGKN